MSIRKSKFDNTVKLPKHLELFKIVKKNSSCSSRVSKVIVNFFQLRLNVIINAHQILAKYFETFVNEKWKTPKLSLVTKILVTESLRFFFNLGIGAANKMENIIESFSEFI